jgi:hypothetical protein
MTKLVRAVAILSALFAPSAVLACFSGPAHTWDWANPGAYSRGVSEPNYRFLIGEFVAMEPMPSPAFRRIRAKVGIIKDYGDPPRTGFVEIQFVRFPCGFSPHVGDIGKIALKSGPGELPYLVSTSWGF